MNEGWASDDCDHPAFLVGILWWLACLCIDLCWRDLLCLEDVPTGQWMGLMNDVNVLIEQMVSDISTQIFQLDDRRLRLFLNWLTAHSSKVKATARLVIDQLRGRDIEKRFNSALKAWLESLPTEGMLWEYRIIMDEIAWWRNLDPQRMKMIVESEV